MKQDLVFVEQQQCVRACVGLCLICLFLIAGSANVISEDVAGRSPRVGFVEGYPLEIIAKQEIRDRRLSQLLTRSVVEDLLLWPAGREITVAFRGGTTEARDEIAAQANLWANHGNFTFSFKDRSGDYREWTPSDQAYAADIRIGFNLGGYWSLLGTDCRNPAMVGPGERSMNLSGMSGGRLSPDERGTVIHEFGQSVLPNAY